MADARARIVMSADTSRLEHQLQAIAKHATALAKDLAELRCAHDQQRGDEQDHDIADLTV